MACCNNLCQRYRSNTLPASRRRYSETRKRCTSCEVYLEWGGTRCPCCSSILRTRPRNRFGTPGRQVLVTYVIR